MDLMTLAAKITLDDDSFKSGIKNAESMGEHLAGKMSAMTVAVGNLVADVVRKGVAGIQNVIGGAIDGYANYQQLIGGVETLFKGSADKVAAYAKQSFKNTGLSANDYMETVTSFSASLLQGLKGDTDAAAELANTAVQDMADNANKMGTDISSIQTAYQGFAKQNFTMLDNLKLGYGGTKEEMVRLINDSGILDKKIKNLDNVTFDQMIEAIHKIQEEMGITGTTAKEAAETISGSKASLKAAWDDLMAAVGGAGDMTDMDTAVENFKQSFSNYMTNFLPALTSTVANSGTLVTAVAESIANLPTDLLSKVGEAGLESGTEMVGGIGKIANWLIDNLITMFQNISIDSSKVTEFGTAIGEFLGSTISNIAGNIDVIAEGIVNLGVALAGSLIEGLFKGLFGEGNEVDKIGEELSSNLVDVETQTTKSSAILKYMQELVDKYGEAATETAEWKSAEGELEEIMSGSGEVFESYGSNVQGAIDKLQALNQELRNTAIMNALTKASSQQWELLTQQEVDFQMAKGSYGTNKAISEDIINGLISTITTEAAGKKAGMIEQFGSYEEMGVAQKDLYNQYDSLSKGMSNVGDRMTGLSDLDFSGLKDALNFLDSKAYTDEELEGKRIAYEQAVADMETAEANMKEAQKQIEATEKAIAETEAAVAEASKKLLSGGKDAGDSIEAGGNMMKTALEYVARSANEIALKLAAFEITNPFATLLGGLFMPRAVGIDYVPYDGFKTELHRGEAVITKEENQRRNGRMDFDMLEASLEDAIERSMARMSIDMNGERVGDITTRRISQNIMNSERSYMRAMGG